MKTSTLHPPASFRRPEHSWKRLLIASISVFALCCCVNPAHAQGVGINATGAAADASAMLDVNSVTKGMLVPRMTKAQRLAISTPASGLLVYQTDFTSGLYLNAGSSSSPAWIVFGAGTTLSGNTAVGLNSLGANTGTFNTATGTNALSANSSGTYNTASGGYALTLNVSGGFNTATGYNALYSNVSGYYNSADGYAALFNNTTGQFNTASGYDALFFNTIGGNNTAIGYAALNQNSSGNHNTAGGNAALYFDTSGSYNTASGDHALGSNTTGNNNSAFGSTTLTNNLTGTNLTAIGYAANVSTDGLTNATAIGNGAVVNASNKIRLGNGSVTVVEGPVAYTFTSDSTKKENHREVDGEETLEKIKGMKLDSWNYKGQDPSSFRHYGPMAQDFYAKFGDDGVGRIGTDTTICSGDLAGISLVAIQALEKRTAELRSMKEELSSLRAENAQLRKINDQLAGVQAAASAKIVRIEKMLEQLEVPSARTEKVSHTELK